MVICRPDFSAPGWFFWISPAMVAMLRKVRRSIELSAIQASSSSPRMSSSKSGATSVGSKADQAAST